MRGPRRGTVLVVRGDSAGDVVLAGPAVRAVAASARRVVVLAGPRGRAAAEVLPGVDEVVTWRMPWIDPEPSPLDPRDVAGLLARLQEIAPDEALILTSFHQSALPMALLLRLAGVPRIAAISGDYPGSLLDVRHVVEESVDVPEAERMLGLAEAAGFSLPPGDDGALAVRYPLPDVSGLTGPPGYVVVHPGASVPARAWPPTRHAQTVRALRDAGLRVVVTGGPGERSLTAFVAGPDAIRPIAHGPGGAHGPVGRPGDGEVIDLGGCVSFAELAGVIARAGAVVVGNTGPAHVAAAVGTPVVSLFAPVVPAARWAPYRVPCTLLGDQNAPCAGSRARVCPVPGHPCLSNVTSAQVVAAVREVAAVKEATR